MKKIMILMLASIAVLSVFAIAACDSYSDNDPILEYICDSERQYIFDNDDNYIMITFDPPVSLPLPNYTIPKNIIAQFDQTLSQIQLPPGWTWVDPTIRLTRPCYHTHNAIYTTTNIQNYALVNILRGITIYVADIATPPAFENVAFGTILGDLILPFGCRWENGNQILDNSGLNSFNAIYACPQNSFFAITRRVYVTVRVYIENEMSCEEAHAKFQFTRIQRTYTATVRIRDRSVEQVIIPSHVYLNGVFLTVVEVASSGITHLPNLTRVVLPSTIYRLRNMAFFNNPNLESVYLPEGLRIIGISAFGLASHIVGEVRNRLNAIVIPLSVQRIDNNVFNGIGPELIIHVRADAPGADWGNRWNYTSGRPHNVIFNSNK